MGGFKRLCLALWSLASAFVLVALGLTWVGPWRDVMSTLMCVDAWFYAVEICFVVAMLGIVIALLRALFSRRVRTVEVVTVDGGVISVAKEAIASQAAHVVEADGTCVASKVNVSAKPRGHVRVHVRVTPRESVDVVEKGAELHTELLAGLAAVCGDKVEDVSLEFVTPESVRMAAPAPVGETDEAQDDAADEAPISVEVSLGAAGPDSTSEITVPMNGTVSAGKEA